MLALFDWTPAENDQTGTHEFVSGLLDMAQGAGAPIMNQTVCLPQPECLTFSERCVLAAAEQGYRPCFEAAAVAVWITRHSWCCRATSTGACMRNNGDSWMQMLLSVWLPDAVPQKADAQCFNQTCDCEQLPYLETIQSFSPQQQYPGVTSYAISAIIPPENQKAASDILNAGFANVTSPLSNIIVDYPTLLDGKSNNDTAYGWRGNAVIYVWVSVEPTASATSA